MLHVSASLWEYYRDFYAEKKDASGFGYNTTLILLIMFSILS